MTVAIVTALPEELRALLRRAKIERRETTAGRAAYFGWLQGTPVVLMATGDAAGPAEASLRELLRRADVARIVGIGIAGALWPDLAPGEIVGVARILGGGSPVECAVAPNPGKPVVSVAVHSAESIAATGAAKRKLAETFPEAAAVDTESLGWVRAAADAGVPISIFRVIFDRRDEDLPAIVGQNVDRGAVIRRALLRPWIVPDLLRLRSRIRRASERIAAFVTALFGGDADELEGYLQETSRTFALCIPLLPQPTRHQVTLAYLLFRIADTFEDAAEWPADVRIRALGDFCALLRDPDPDAARQLASSWQAGRPIAHAGYLDLLAHVPAVIDAFRALPAEPKEVMKTHVIRSAEGMAQYVSRTDAAGNLQLQGRDDLRRYCYTVAGIVGEMLTELFLLGAPVLASAAQALRDRAAEFGEALQLVNILKDAADDRSEGRTYIPKELPLRDVFALARNDLDVARDYTLRMQRDGAPRGIVAFAALPVALAQATLDRVEKFGPGAKVSRPEVFRIVRKLDHSLDRGLPAL
ncbi:MAG TPA: squalene/phytoene synthase family protein [Thermoanaerobaculia bacterium]|nr:squalene/phytoene synthase family protein [Thermoanaerobaculia bacterium]